MPTIRCKLCGGTLHHWLTAITGELLYICTTALTTMPDPTRHGRRLYHHKMRTELCDTIHNAKGQIFSGTVAYRSENKIHTLIVKDGKRVAGT